MTQIHTPIILAGQLYLNDFLNEYLIVTKSYRGQIGYAGKGFKGNLDSETFLERFLPVNPVDVDEPEIEFLVSLCQEGTNACTGTWL